MLNPKSICVFCSFRVFSFSPLSFSAYGDEIDVKGTDFIHSSDISIVSAQEGSYDLTVNWGGKVIKVSELKDTWGFKANERLWDTMGDS